MAMRVQISLQFDDKDLFDNFITPYKNGRVLNGLIIKCLSAYYYSEDVRNMIEGTSLEDATDGEGVQSTQSLCDDLRASLLMQDFFAGELRNVIGKGTEDIGNILDKTNDLARKSGVAKPNKSEYDADVLKISVADAKEVANSPAKFRGSDTVLDTIRDAVVLIAKSIGNKEVVEMLHPDEEEEPEVTVQESEPEVTIQEPEPEVQEAPEPPEVEEPEPEVPVVELDEDFVTEEVIPTDNDFDDDSGSDASDSMKELLGSLF